MKNIATALLFTVFATIPYSVTAETNGKNDLSGISEKTANHKLRQANFSQLIASNDKGACIYQCGPTACCAVTTKAECDKKSNSGWSQGSDCKNY